MSATAHDYSAYAQAKRRPTRDSRNNLGNSTSGVEAKVVVMGSAGVGKTSLVQRYTTNQFNSTKIAATAGAAFHVKKTIVNGVTIRLQLWDTAGQERFRSLAPMYYRGSHAALLVYDITNPASFDDLKVWLEELKKNIPPESENDMIIFIVGAKSDLAPQQRKVTVEQARATLASWFPPPKPPTPPPHPSSMPYYGPGYPFNHSSSIYPASQFSFPSPLTSISTSVSTHLPTLPSFNIGLPTFNQIRPRFSSLTSAATKPVMRVDIAGESPTGTDSTGATTATTSSSGAMTGPSTSSASGTQSTLVPPTGSRFAISRSTTSAAAPGMSELGLNVNMSGSGYSAFSRTSPSTPTSETTLRTNGVATPGIDFPSAANGPGLVRRNTAVAAYSSGSSAGGAGSSGMRPSRSMGGRPIANGSAGTPRSRLISCLSDDEDAIRGRERRPAAFRRVEDLPSVQNGLSGIDESSSKEELDRMYDYRPGGPGVARLKREREREEARLKEVDRRRKEEEAVTDEEDDDLFPTWSFSKELRICEVSAKDGLGVEELFSSLLQTIIKRRDIIERDKWLRERDSVMLNVPTTVPSWGALAEEEDSAILDTGYSWGSCCRI
ncbi:hypothetical protein FRB99_006851 [Tulasnella sp. 403]|nr:hypothetical protein FRB99_006851 [Tulasnella sp. 403]